MTLLGNWGNLNGICGLDGSPDAFNATVLILMGLPWLCKKVVVFLRNLGGGKKKET